MTTFEPIWGPSIAAYLFLAGLGAGAYIFAFLLRELYPQAEKMRRYTHFIVPVVIVIGLVLLLTDAPGGLHHPLRLILLLTNFTSVMTWGVYFLVVFLLVSLWVAIIELKKGYQIPRLLDAIGLIFAFCVALYTGVLLGVCKTFPLWNNALLPILFLVSALSAGGATVMLIGGFFAPKELEGLIPLKKVQYVLPIIELLLLAALMFITQFNSTAGAASVHMLVAGVYAPWFWGGLVFCGLLLHVIVETKLLFFSTPEVEAGKAARYTSIAVNLLVLVGGFLLRLLVILAAVPIAIAL